MLRYDRQTRPGLVALYGIRPGNGAGNSYNPGARTGRFPLKLGIGAGSQKKTRVMGPPGRERSLTISSAVWIEYNNVTDGQTDGHRATAKTALTHSVGR